MEAVHRLQPFRVGKQLVQLTGGHFIDYHVPKIQFSEPWMGAKIAVVPGTGIKVNSKVKQVVTFIYNFCHAVQRR
jgi:hypothetical protein